MRLPGPNSKIYQRRRCWAILQSVDAPAAVEYAIGGETSSQYSGETVVEILRGGGVGQDCTYIPRHRPNLALILSA